MQRAALILAYFIICANCFSQQYPFVHYTPKDGLVNSRVKKAYQDSKGRMYFMTSGGLSVYDGARFRNYTAADGLGSNLINDIIEVGDDSLLIGENTAGLRTLVRGVVVKIRTEGEPCPLINQFCPANGKIYLASDDGLFVLENKTIRKLNVSFAAGATPYIGNIAVVKNTIIITRYEFNDPNRLYLYDILENRMDDASAGQCMLLGKDDHDNVWIAKSDKLFVLDSSALARKKLMLVPPPKGYRQTHNYPSSVVSFGKNNVWMIFRDKNHRNIDIRRIDENGGLLQIPLPQSPKSSDISSLMVDKENMIWLSSNGEGVFKLSNSLLQIFDHPFENLITGHISDVFLSGDIIWYRTSTNKLLQRSPNGLQLFECNLKVSPLIFNQAGNKILGRDISNIFEAEIGTSKKIYFHPIISLTPPNIFLGKLMVDRNGFLLASTKTGLQVWKNNQPVFMLPVDLYDEIEEIAFDNNNLLWLISRYNGIQVCKLHPEDPAHYIEPLENFSKKDLIGSPRSFVLDKKNIAWIGTRDHGVTGYQTEGSRLRPIYHFDVAQGLTDNFVTALACDSSNNILVGTQTGVDRLVFDAAGAYRVEDLSKSSNFFALIHQSWTDDRHAYALSFAGAILQISSSPAEKIYTHPSLLLQEMRVNGKTISDEVNNFDHNENNIAFFVAAPSFVDEKQVSYSYLLQGSGSNRWSDTFPSNATINLINLSPRDYVLKVQAFFPSTSYLPAELSYAFTIRPPWWQTWWFRSVAALLIIGLMIIGFRFYFKKRLEKQTLLLEKQQAIEKERTRIATDMHDDLGAGLSRIKFLSQSILNKKPEDEIIKTELEKITSFSDEMSEKMGEIVWALNEKNDTLADLIAYTRSYAVEYLANHNIQCEANTPLHLPGTFITGEMRRNIFLSVKECLHNIVKHAGATQVCFSVQLEKMIQIVIHDNGKGIDWNNRRAFSNGLLNIQRRMKEINGEVNFANEQGTKVSLTIPFIL